MGSILEVFRRPDFLNQLLVHVELSVVALLIGVAIALPVALAVYRSPLASALAVNTGNIGRAVPSLAILALVFPLLGFGFDTALVALVLLAIPPILINASTGLRQVDPEIIDAARGMGLSGGQILGRIQLPIALPVVFAGIRTSAVQVVASATLATFIGGGGLGRPHSPGLSAQRPGRPDRGLPGRRGPGNHHGGLFRLLERTLPRRACSSPESAATSRQ
jgi:osmoprotectant transport system permease protein